MLVLVLENGAGCFQSTVYHTALDSRTLDMHERAYKAFSKGALDNNGGAMSGPRDAGDDCMLHPTPPAAVSFVFDARPSPPLIALSQATTPVSTPL